MTREEAIKELERAVDVLDHQCHMDNRKKEAFNMAIKALSVEPCEDGAWSLKDAADALKRHGLLQEQEPCEDTISFPKGTLKKRGKGYVVYDVEWFKKNWRTELKVMGVECEDCISRAELLKAIDTWDRFGVDDTNSLFRLDNLSLPHYVPYIHFDDVVKCIKGMPSVTPKQKMGHWVKISPAGIYECSECGQNVMTGDIDAYRHCHGCGAKMSENPTGSESEDT